MTTTTTTHHPAAIVRSNRLSTEVLPLHPTGELTTPTVSAKHGFANPSQTARYLELCTLAGITDPTAAAELLERSRHLRSTPVGDLTGATSVDAGDIARLADGKLDPAKVKVAVVDDHARAVAKARKRATMRAADQLLVDVAASIRDHGDQLIAAAADVLDHTIAAAADRTATRDQLHDIETRWSAAVDLLDLLRRNKATPVALGATEDMYLFTNSTAVHRWRCDHASNVRVATWEEEGHHYLARRPTGRLGITATIAAEHRDEWGYRVRTATEVAADWSPSATPPPIAA